MMTLVVRVLSVLMDGDILMRDASVDDVFEPVFEDGDDRLSVLGRSVVLIMAMTTSAADGDGAVQCRSR